MGRDGIRDRQKRWLPWVSLQEVGNKKHRISNLYRWSSLQLIGWAAHFCLHALGAKGTYPTTVYTTWTGP